MERLTLALTLCLLLVGPALAQEGPPSTYGELAVVMVGEEGINLGITDPLEAIAVLEAMGISHEKHVLISGFDDGLGPWLPTQELTPEFLCKLEMTAWAAAFVGNVPGFEPADDELASREAAGSAFVALIVALSGQDPMCVNPPPPATPPAQGEEPCYHWVWHWGVKLVCQDRPGLLQCPPVCQWVKYKVWSYVPCEEG